MAAVSDVLAARSDPLALISNLPTLDETYGAMMLGTFLGLILYGVVLHQAYRYFRLYHNDRTANKNLVVGLLAVDTIHSVMTIHACHSYLISDYLQPFALLRGIWSLQIQPLLAGFAVLLCQTFFARRVYTISPKHRILVAMSIFLSCGTFGFSIAGTVIAFKFHVFTQYQHFYWIDSAACGAAVAADALTTSVLIVTLQRSRTGFKQTDTMLNRLMLYAINTGLLTGISNSLALIFALARPNTFIWIGIEIVAMRLYTNSVLAVLNSRRSLRENDDSDVLELRCTSLASRAPDMTRHTYNHSESAEASILHVHSLPMTSLNSSRTDEQVVVAPAQKPKSYGRAWDSDTVININITGDQDRALEP